MAAITAPQTSFSAQLRPLNVLRDLPAVADLVETCFANTLDDDGRRFLQQMRRSGRDNAFIRWATQVADTVSMPLTGYVWEEGGQVIGNASLIPYRHNHKKYYLIANVAVHPNHRQHGIGSALTRAALEHAWQKHVSEIWLHVRDDNPGAIHLYENLGFKELAQRSSWRLTLDRITCPKPAAVQISNRRKRDWIIQEKHLHRTYPEFMEWYQPLPWSMLTPGFIRTIERFLLMDETRHWVVRDGKDFFASLSWQPSVGDYPDHLWAALPEFGAEKALQTLLTLARFELSSRRSTLALDLPRGEYSQSIQDSGFRLQRTLLWMKWDETTPKENRT
jgi:ribosomal protein S18 acetylase RimI-like enzyme